MATANVVYASPATDAAPVAREARIATGETLTPGSLVEFNANGEFVAHATAGAGGDVMVIDMATAKQQGVNDALVAGDTHKAFVHRPGCAFNLVLASGQTIGIGDGLTSDGAGAVRAVGAGEAVLFVAEEAVTTTTDTGRILARAVAG